ncbi:polysaccharide biosynthesis/export family protein [Novosphingobium sp.]|uniref:polysaccharide biosynthesis/export family protein n=1 Tax=Novosphingobium sp. TaxID=1874826 RepID=UPI0031D09C13
MTDVRVERVGRCFQKSLLLLSLCGALGGCAALPSNGPTAGSMSKGAQNAHMVPYSLVDITPDVIHANHPVQNLGVLQLAALSSGGTPARADMIRNGDTLTITIFEVGVSLFSGQVPVTEAIRTPTAGAQQMLVAVREDGTADLPYLGTVHAAGTYPEQLAEELRHRLRRMSESPQVQVNISDTAHNVVYVSGAVAKPGRYRLTAAHEKLLDMLALAGGAADNINNVDIKLTRGTHVAQAPLNEVSAEDLANLEIQSDDRIEIVSRKNTYTVFGATDKVSQIPFETRDVTLAEAIARAAGPADARANARGVYLFRMEKGENGGSPHATVYHINMLKPESYFLAQMFVVKDRDVILFSNSSSNITQKMLGLLSQLFSPALSIRYATQ